MNDITTGTEALRAAVRARVFKGATIARDIGVANETLDSFVRGKTTWPVDKLKALAKELFGDHVEYDETIDRLRTKPSEATSIGTGPPPLDPKTLPKYQAGPHLGHRPVKPEPVKPKAKRPGWVE